MPQRQYAVTSNTSPTCFHIQAWLSRGDTLVRVVPCRHESSTSDLTSAQTEATTQKAIIRSSLLLCSTLIL
jgi:hypothetical protein